MDKEKTNKMSKEKPIINVSDLELMVQIIDTCSRRGAFEGKEMAGIGEVRNRIVSVVNSYTEKPADETDTVTPKTEAPEETSA